MTHCWRKQTLAWILATISTGSPSVGCLPEWDTSTQREWLNYRRTRAMQDLQLSLFCHNTQSNEQSSRMTMQHTLWMFTKSSTHFINRVLTKCTGTCKHMLNTKPCCVHVYSRSTKLHHTEWHELTVRWRSKVSKIFQRASFFFF